MTELGLDLPVIWAILISVAIAAYVVMDGFDLGIGILFPTFAVGPRRDKAMNTIAPVWDGNETWLVLGGGGLMAAFPIAYSVLLSALYAPIIAMLLALVLRGVAFEFRWRDPSHRAMWDTAFFVGSTIAAFSQGIVLGAILEGIPIEGRAYAGGWWDWLTPFSILTGFSIVAGYALLGAGWLIMKTSDDLQSHAFGVAKILAIGLLVLIGVVSLATPFLEQSYYQRWFAWPNIGFVAFIPVLVIGVSLMLFRALAAEKDYQPFFLSLCLFALSMAGLAISMWPDIIPGNLSIWDAAAPPESQGFMLVGAVILLPIIITYTAWAYWVFRGKVEEDGYH